MNMNIIKKQIIYNRKKRTRKPVYIVIHDTGNTAKGANANAHFNYFNGGERGASADFFVDDTQVLQINDYNTYYTYHVGDGKGKYGITNSNSIGVEICVNSDGDYNKAFENAVQLTKQLMTELNISAERVVRHYDASRKNCPASMSADGWRLWDRFKEKITEDEPMTKEERMKFNLLVEAVENLKAENEILKQAIGWNSDNTGEPALYAYNDENIKKYIAADGNDVIGRVIKEGRLSVDANGAFAPLSKTALRLLIIQNR